MNNKPIYFLGKITDFKDGKYLVVGERQFQEDFRIDLVQIDGPHRHFNEPAINVYPGHPHIINHFMKYWKWVAEQAEREFKKWSEQPITKYD